MSKLKIGWVGSGFVGQVAHMVNYAEMADAEIVALAELRPELGRAVCRRYDIPRFYASHKALLEDPDVEAVVAVVRRHHTGPVGLDVLNAGRHLFTEKPMAHTLDQGQRLVAAAAAGGLCYAVGFMRRHDEGVQIYKRLLDELRQTQELGSVLSVRVYLASGEDYCNIGGHVKTDEPRPMHQIWPIAPDWVPEAMHLEYEHFLNVCSHDLNLIRFLFGQRPRVKYVEYRRSAGSVVVLDFGEFSGIFQWGDINQNRWEEGVEIHFERGRLDLELPPAFLRNTPASVKLYKDHGRQPGEVICPTPDRTWAFRREDEAFVENVRQGTQPLAHGEDCLEDMHFLEDVWRHIVSDGDHRN